MDEKTKNRFDSLASLWKGAWEQFNERRKYEFQISIAVWTALGSFTALILTSKDVKFSESVSYCSAVGLIAILGIYANWRNYLAKANRKDFAIAIHYERLLQEISNSQFDESLKSKLALSKRVEKYPILGWAVFSQISITTILCIAAFLSIVYKS